MSSNTYRSKIDGKLIAFLIVVLGVCAAVMSYQRIWVGLAIIVLVAAFVAYNIASIRYKIDQKNLIIITGIAPRKVIPIEKIWKISLSGSIVSSPAASLSRIGIHYNNPAPVLLSPRKQDQFIGELTALNPKIEVKV